MFWEYYHYRKSWLRNSSVYHGDLEILWNPLEVRKSDVAELEASHFHFSIQDWLSSPLHVFALIFSPLQSLGRRKRAHTSQNKTRNLCHFAFFPFYITSQAQPQFLTDLLKIRDCHALRSRFSASPSKKLCYKDAYLHILAQFLAFKHNLPFKKRSKLTPYLTELFLSLLYRRALRH
jgi:hypothetical protein